MNGYSDKADSAGSGRREKRRLQRRQGILDAAEQVFAAHGFHEASIDKIAEAAEYAPGTIYLYFKDKDALYTSLVASKITRMVDFVERAAEKAKDPLEGLLAAIRAQFEFHDANREFFEVFIRDRRPPPPGNGAEWRNIVATMARHKAALVRLIARARRRKVIRSGSSEDFAGALLGMIIHMTHESMHGLSPAQPLAPKADFVFDLFLNGARRDE